MREILEQRVRDLRAEMETGQRMAAELEGQLSYLRTTVLRISGAVQVLEELLSSEEHLSVSASSDASKVGA